MTIGKPIILTIGLLVGAPGHAVTVEFVEADYEFSSDERAEIRAIAESSVSDVRDVLPELPEDIRLTVSAGTGVIPQIGATAQVLDRGHIGWTVNPSHSGGVTRVAHNSLRSTLVHELHHLARMEAGSPVNTVMDVVVSEGLAVAFARDLGARDPLGLATYPDDAYTWVEDLVALPGPLDVAFADGEGSKWMFRRPDGRQWITYRAGTYIVDRATEASGRSTAELVSESTEEVLRLAGIE